jgi:S1-C subfamily serine protease
LPSRDTITAIGGAPAADDSAFARIIDSHKVGGTIAWIVVRDGQTI